MMSTRKKCDLYSLCSYANVILLFYFASAYMDPLDGINQPTMLNGWMATGGDPCGQNWTGVSCSYSSNIFRKISELGLGGTMSSQLSSFHSLTQPDSCRDRVANVILLFYFASAYADPLDVKSLEDLYGLLNQPTMLNGWMATGGDPCGQNWTGVSCSYSSIISRYMHEICSPRIAHGNIKAGNALFDEEFVPFTMLSHILRTTSMDFKMFGGSGYTAPEMSILGSDMIKGHLFSFGVLLQELLAAALAMTLAVYLNLRQSSSRSVGLLPALIGALFVLPILQVAAANQAVKDDETLLAIYVGLAGLIGTAAAIMAIPLPESKKGWTKTAGKILTCTLDVVMLILLIATVAWGYCIHRRSRRASASTRVEMKTIISGFFAFFVCLGICIVWKVFALTLLDIF